MERNTFKSVILMCLAIFMFTSCYSQINDENTYLINQYFQSNNANYAKSDNTNLGKEQNTLGVVLNQVGTNNTIDIKSTSNNSQEVTQSGDGNYYKFINYYNNGSSNINILQQGTSNSLQIYGENSIIENISILQKSNNKTIIINNY